LARSASCSDSRRARSISIVLAFSTDRIKGANSHHAQLTISRRDALICSSTCQYGPKISGSDTPSQAKPNSTRIAFKP